MKAYTLTITKEEFVAELEKHRKQCDFCKQELPGGCYGMSARYRECPLDEPKSIEWKIGRAIWNDLTDRRGIKYELNACDPEIQAEIVNTMGKLAMREINKGKRVV